MMGKSVKLCAVLLCGLVLTLTGCADSKLKLAVEAFSKTCPVSLGETGELRSVTYEDNAVVFCYVMNEQLSNISAMAEHPDVMRQNAKTMFSNPADELKTMMDLAIEANASIRFVYEGRDSGQKTQIELTADELREARRNADATPMDKLQAAISSTNIHMPLDAGDGVVVTQVAREGNVTFYRCMVDENEAGIAQIRINQKAVKKALEDEVRQMSAADRAFIQIIVSAGCDLGYRYVGNESGDSLDVVLTNQELLRLLEE